jgi:hypothetical protein
MPRTDTSASGFFVQTWRWLKGQIVGEVPPEDALCEFDCPKWQCTEGEWATCERRLSRAAGELMPDGHDARKLPAKS